MFVCDRSFESQSRGLMKHAYIPVEVRTIAAGKLRRYHDQNLWQRLTDFEAIILNIRDISRIIWGFLQGNVLLARYRPDVVFAKGGFVCLPLGLAAWLWRVPLVIHDSDARPGLTNRVLSRFAQVITTGSPLENYCYDPSRSHYVGVPIDKAFHPYGSSEQRQAKGEIGIIDTSAPLVVITGGGLGARSINTAIAAAAPDLLARGLHIYHICGKLHVEVMQAVVPEHPHYHLVPFVYKDMHRVLGAADIIVARGSATFLQEMAALAKPVIVVPAVQLSDQVKNAEIYAAAEAVRALTDHDILHSSALRDTILELMDDEPERERLSHHLHQFAKPHAARDLAEFIQSAVQKDTI